VTIFAANNLPAGLSSTLKQFFFDKNRVDVFQLTCFVSWSQLALTWIFVPLLSLPGFGGIPMSKIGFVFENGAKCFIGDRSIPIYNEKMEVIGHCSPEVALTTMIFSTSG